MKVFLTKKAKKRISKLSNKQKARVAKLIDELETSPYYGKKIFGKSKEYRRVKIPPLRVIYTISEKEKKIIIETVGYRGDVYKKLTILGLA